MNLEEQLALAVAESKKAFENGDHEKGQEWAEKAKILAESVKSVRALNTLIPEVKRDINQVATVTGSGTQTTEDPTHVAAQSTTKSTDLEEDFAQKAAYVTRFGDSQKAVDGILTDLHGSDYQRKYWAQRNAFNRYLRMPADRPITEDMHKAMSEIILTPAIVQQALATGVSTIEGLKSTMVEGTNTLGGYIVPVDFQAQVIERLAGLTVMRGRAFATQTSRDRVEYPVATGGDGQYTSAVRVTWTDETPTGTEHETNLTFGMEHIPVHTVMASVPISRNLLEDAAFPLEPYLSTKLAEAAAIDEDNQFLTGNGQRKPEGILPGGANTRGLTEVNSGSAAALTWDGITKLTYGIQSQYRMNASFIGSRSTYEAIALLKDGENRAYWNQNAFNMSDDGKQTRLKGHDVLEQEIMPTVAANAFPLLFGDPTGYQIVDRVGMSIERFLDSSTAVQNQVKIVMRRRLGGQVTEPWKFVTQKVSV